MERKKSSAGIHNNPTEKKRKCLRGNEGKKKRGDRVREHITLPFRF